MRECLYQNNHARILLTSTADCHDCWWNDKESPAGVTTSDGCVRCGTSVHAETTQLILQARYENSGMSVIHEARCCLQHAQDLLNDVFSERSEGELEEYDRVYHNINRLVAPNTCLWCCETIKSGQWYYTFQDRLAVHNRCAAELGNVIQQAFDETVEAYADELLGASL